MKMHIKDYVWITAITISGLLLLNIFIGVNSHRYPKINGRISYTEAPLNKNYVRPAEPEVSFIEPGQQGSERMAVHFELLGTLISKSSLAFIYDSDTKVSGLYRVNDNIGGLKIFGIFPGKVLLNKDGAVYELLLAAGSRPGTGEKRSMVTTDESGTMIVSKLQMVAQLIRAHELLNKIKIMPLPDVTSNKLKGFRIDSVPQGSIIEEVGIRNGDVICSVQGQKLQSMQDALQIFNKIQSQSRIEVVLLRGDNPITLRYEIR